MFELPRTQNSSEVQQPRVLVIGLGNAGSNALDRVYLDGLPDATLIAMNTDAQSLLGSVAPQKMQLGKSLVRGLGAGGDPEVGYAAAEESVEELREAFDQASLVFLLTGLGGGTGSGAAPLIASLAREAGATVVVFATLPFTFEGRRRNQQAREALDTLRPQADVVICFENDKLASLAEPEDSISANFSSADQALSQSVRAITKMVSMRGLMQVGLADLATAVGAPGSHCGFGHGEADGDNRAYEAIERALRGPLMAKARHLDQAQSILVHVTGGASLTLNEVQLLMEELNRRVGEDVQILFGCGIDPSLGDRVTVTVFSAIDGNTERNQTSTAVRRTERLPVAESAPLSVAPTEEPHVESLEQEYAEAVASRDEERREPVISFVDTDDSFDRDQLHTPLEDSAIEEIEEDALSDEEGEVEEGAFAEDEASVEASYSDVEDSECGIEDEESAEQETGVEFAVEQTEEVEAEAQSYPSEAEFPVRLTETVPVAHPESRQREPRQEQMTFEPIARGKFEKTEPTIVDGQDLDVPTFLRQNFTK